MRVLQLHTIAFDVAFLPAMIACWTTTRRLRALLCFGCLQLRRALMLRWFVGCLPPCRSERATMSLNVLLGDRECLIKRCWIAFLQKHGELRTASEHKLLPQAQIHEVVVSAPDIRRFDPARKIPLDASSKLFNSLIAFRLCAPEPCPESLCRQLITLKYCHFQRRVIISFSHWQACVHIECLSSKEWAKAHCPRVFFPPLVSGKSFEALQVCVDVVNAFVVLRELWSWRLHCLHYWSPPLTISLFLLRSYFQDAGLLAQLLDFVCPLSLVFTVFAFLCSSFPLFRHLFPLLQLCFFSLNISA